MTDTTKNEFPFLYRKLHYREGKTLLPMENAPSFKVSNIKTKHFVHLKTFYKLISKVF